MSALALTVAVAVPGWAGDLEVTFVDVGQADATLVTCPDGDHHLLIDAGDTRYPGSADAFRAFLDKQFAGKPRRLTMVVASHPHADHIGSMQWVLEHFTVDTYVDNGQKGDTALFGDLDALRRQQVQAGTLTYINGKDSSFDTVDLCPGVTLEFIEPWAQKASLSDTNDRSLAVRLKYDSTSFLFVGDIEQDAEAVMLDEFTDEQRKVLDVDVLKVGHHGSDTSSTARFVSAVSPRIAIVSSGRREVGTNVIYKHPRVSTLRTYVDWFKNNQGDQHPENGKVWGFDRGAKKWRMITRRTGLWLTTKDGPIVVRSDGHDVHAQPGDG